jgi:head-tail adaptor
MGLTRYGRQVNTPLGRYDLRVAIVARVLAAQGGNGEQTETWPGPGKNYFAARDSVTAGEDIAQGIRQSTGGMRLRIRGRAIPVSAADRVVKATTGEVFEVVGVAREKGETVLTCERVRDQGAGQ